MTTKRIHSNISQKEYDRVNNLRKKRKEDIRVTVTRTDAKSAMQTALDEVCKECNILLSAVDLFPDDSEWHSQIIDKASRATAKLTEMLCAMGLKQEKVNAENKEDDDQVDH